MALYAVGGNAPRIHPEAFVHPLAVVIGRCYNGTTLPVVGGFAALSILSTLMMRWVGNVFDPEQTP